MLRMDMKTRNHKILDHPVLGDFLLMIFSFGHSYNMGYRKWRRTGFSER